MMEIEAHDLPAVLDSPAELDRLGAEIAELSSLVTALSCGGSKV
jgi:hypothetical protein